MDEILSQYELRNAVVFDAERPSIDCEVNHPEWGWTPITVTQEEYPLTYAKAEELL